MSTQPNPSEGLIGLLAGYRAAYDAGGLAALSLLAPGPELDLVEPPADDHGLQASYYEVLGLDAMSRQRPGWAFVCIEAAASHAEQGALRTEPARLRRTGMAILQHAFPPYESDDALLAEVREWARARVVELTAMPLEDRPVDERVAAGAVITPVTSAKQRWMFRLLHSQRLDRSFRTDALFARFLLGGRERVLLRTLAALHWDARFDHLRGGKPFTVGLLVDLVADDPAERPEWLACLDARAPLVDSGLVHLGQAASLHTRTVALDESVPAWLEGRDDWPPALADVATVLAPDERPIYPYQDRAVAELRRALDPRRGAGPRVAVRSRSAVATRNLVLTWAASARRPVIVLQPGARLDPATARALGREARLRGAVVLLEPADASQGVALDRHVHAPTVFHAAPDVLAALRRALPLLVDVDLPPPPRLERPNLWNDALIAHGLPELAPRDLEAHLGEFVLDQAEIHQIVAQAVERAWVVGDRAPRVLEAADLRSVATAWGTDQR